MVLMTAFYSSFSIEKKEESCSVYDLQHLRVTMDHSWSWSRKGEIFELKSISIKQLRQLWSSVRWCDKFIPYSLETAKY